MLLLPRVLPAIQPVKLAVLQDLTDVPNASQMLSCFPQRLRRVYAAAGIFRVRQWLVVQDVTLPVPSALQDYPTGVLRVKQTLCYQVPARIHACALLDIFQTEHRRVVLYAILHVHCAALLGHQGALLATHMRNYQVEIPPPASVLQDTSQIRLPTIVQFAVLRVQPVLEG
jgi:hypothetical protein